MSKKTGWTATGMITATAALGFSLLSPSGRGKPTETPEAQSAQTASAKAKVNPDTSGLNDGPCIEIERRLQDFFTTQKHAAPVGCFKASESTRNTLDTKGMSFAIAILPDPLHTHFSLSFDRYTEAIQQAAQDEGFAYDSSWLPWSTDEKQYGNLRDNSDAEKMTSRKEDQPGILLFRGPATKADAPGLAIFVIGDEPTGGIHRDQFQNALAWINALGGGATAPSASQPGRPLRIIGPSFSGSLPSLAASLLSNSKLKGTTKIYSGAVTDGTAVESFSVATGRDKRTIQFRSFQQSDNVQIGSYCGYLFSRGVSADHVAIISEDETAFGASENIAAKEHVGHGQSPKDPSCDEPGNPSPIRASYPRDISALRSAYQAQSLFSIKAKSMDSDLTRRALKTDLADPEGKQHDTIRTYSGSQTALSQEASLQQIVRMLRVHRTQYIVLRSSNPLDQIFLTRYLMLEYPEGRIAVATADLLLERDLDTNGISGVTTLSSYPLIPSVQDWTIRIPLSHIHRPFTNSEAEGTYVATRFLLHDPALELSSDTFAPHACAGELQPSETCKSNTTGKSEPLAADKRKTQPTDKKATPSSGNCDQNQAKKIGTKPAGKSDKAPTVADYSVPFWSENFQKPAQPDVWVSVLGHGGFWPVSAMERGKSLEPKDSERLSHVVHGLLRTPWRNLSAKLTGRGLDVPISMNIVLLFVTSWVIFHCYCCCQPSVTGKPGFRVHFAWSQLTGSERESQARLVLFGSVWVGLVPLLLAWSMGCFSDDMALPFASWKQRALLASLWFVGLLSLVANAWIEGCLQDSQGAKATGEPKVESWPLIAPTMLRLRARGRAVWRCIYSYVAGTILPIIVFDAVLEWQLNDGNRVPTYIRAMNLTSAVSPVTPFLILIAGLYVWFWFTLKGQALLGVDRPLLPSNVSLTMPSTAPADRGASAPGRTLNMFGRESVSVPIERYSDSASGAMLALYGAITIVLLLGLSLVFGNPPIRSLGANAYSLVCLLWLCGCTALLVGSTVQLLRIWSRLQELLLLLDRTPLRATFKAMDGFSWDSIWTMAGNVFEERYKLYSQQAELLSALGRRPKAFSEYEALPEWEAASTAREKFSAWYIHNWDKPAVRDTAACHAVQEAFAGLAGAGLSRILVLHWSARGSVGDATLHKPQAEGGGPQGDQKPPLDEMALLERFVCLVYIGFIQNTLGRMRSLVSGIIALFIALAFGSTIYPFDPRPLLNGLVVVLFVALGFFISLVYAQMYRDNTLSKLTNTEPGKLGTEFWVKLVGFGVGPVFGVLASVFPEVSNFFFSWMQPGIESLK